jgi:DNA replication and repair protein RecF
VALRQLTVSGFRNLAVQEVPLSLGPTVVLGSNGAGKSNFLEAVTVLGNLVSFRPARTETLISRGEHSFSLGGEIERGAANTRLTQTVQSAGQRTRRLLHRGARRLDADEYLPLLPVIALSTYDRNLIWGGPEERRRYLDRLAFHLHPETLTTALAYRRALSQRNALLVRGGHAAELDGFEHALAQHGGRLVYARQETLALLVVELARELSLLGWSLGTPVLRYHAPDSMVVGDPGSIAARLRAALERGRTSDRQRGLTLAGPHRHDLAITVHGVPVKDVLSAGQGKLLATALRLAAATLLQQTGRARPVVVFDDVDAEFDGDVLRRILARLSECEQAIVSSAHPEMVVPRLSPAAVLFVSAGSVAARSTERGGE